MRKRLLAAILTAAMAASITACSSGTTSSSGGESSPAAPSGTSSAQADGASLSGDLTIWAWGADDEAKAREDAIKVFIDAHPELNVTYTVIPTADAVWDQKASAALASNSAGDVMQMSPDYYGMNTKYYLDLNSYVERDGIKFEEVLLPGMIDGYYDTDGKLEGMPLHTNCFVMAYNKGMFDAKGVPYPQDGWTFQELAEWGKAFAEGSGADQTFAIVKHWVQNNLMLYAGGGSPYTEDLSTSNMGNPEIVEGLTLYNTLISSGIMPTDTAQKTIPAATLFVSGKAAMYPLGGFESALVIGDAEENGIQLGFCSMPNAPDGKEINIQYATGWAVTQASKNPDAAWQFLKESSFANEEMGKINARVGIPSSKVIAESVYADTVVGECKFDNNYYVEHIANAHVNPWGGTLSSAGDLWTAMVDAVTLDGQDPASVQATYAPQIADAFAGFEFNKK